MIQERKYSFAHIRKDLFRNYEVYLIVLPVVLFYFIFRYIPMYGAQIAFKDFFPGKGITGSPWAGFRYFEEFFRSFYFWRLLKNTLLLSVYGIVFSFPAPILLALFLNEIRSIPYKRFVQTITYLPHFISIVVICGMIIDFVKQGGAVSILMSSFSGASENLLLQAGAFRSIYVISDIWQQVGWNSIIYLAALTAIDPQLYEAATIDGAGKLRQVLSITIPGIMPTIMILLILRVGQMLNIGFEKIILLYNPSIYETADVISTFVYRKGILSASYSYASAVGLFNSAISFMLVILANKLSRSTTEHGLW